MEKITIKGIVIRESGIGWRLKDVKKEHKYYEVEILRGIDDLFNANYRNVHLREGDEVEITIKARINNYEYIFKRK